MKIMKTIDELQKLIEYQKELISSKQYEIDSFEPDSDDYWEQYDNMLDECYEGVFNILPSRILSECDPTAYRCGLNDYVDGLDVSDDEKYKTLESELEELENELENLEEELEELEDEN